MAMKKAKPMVAKRVAERKAFVASQTSMPKRPGADGADSSMASNSAAKKAARQKFFVQTRAKELAAKGVTVDAAKRKELRQKFQSGNVSRAGFGAPKKKAASVGSSMTSSKAKPGYSAAGSGKSASQDMAKSKSSSSSMRSSSNSKPSSSSAGSMKAKAKSSSTMKGKSASQDINKRKVTPAYKNK